MQHEIPRVIHAGIGVTLQLLSLGGHIGQNRCDSTNIAAIIILPFAILCNLFSFFVYYTQLYTGFYYFKYLCYKYIWF